MEHCAPNPFILENGHMVVGRCARVDERFPVSCTDATLLEKVGVYPDPAHNGAPMQRHLSESLDSTNPVQLVVMSNCVMAQSELLELRE